MIIGCQVEPSNASQNSQLLATHRLFEVVSLVRWPALLVVAVMFRLVGTAALGKSESVGVVAWSASGEGAAEGESTANKAPSESGEASGESGEASPESGKAKPRLRRARRKKKPMPYVANYGEGEESVGATACDLLGDWGKKWPFALACQREPRFPLSTTLQQRQNGCVLFWRRYVEILDVDGHSTERAVGAWELYDNCMAGERSDAPDLVSVGDPTQ